MSLLLYLMRHGIAQDPGPGMDDADRALTAEGAEKTTAVAKGLRASEVRLDAILSSPLRRAQETARLAGTVLAPDLEVLLRPALSGGVAASDIAAGLRPPHGARQVLVVGHQPDLGELASFLLTGSARTCPLPFKKAAVAAIEVDGLPPRRTGVLHWFLTPGQLRGIAGSKK
ncbi:MAG: phosphohistidine phosphatase SixA [Candidatus Binatia bacterium]